MFPKIAAVFAIFYIILIQNISSSTNLKDGFRSDNLLRDILQRLDQMQTTVNQIQTNMYQMQTHMDDNSRNISSLLETQMEQQMVITAEIFAVSQTLPNCCYDNNGNRPNPDPEQLDNSTTANPLNSLPRNCAEAMGASGSDGVYKVNITNSYIGPFDVYCIRKIPGLLEEDIINGAWLIIQRRQDNTTDFYQNWDMYKRGFGDLNRNYWIGLDKLYSITSSSDQELWIQMEKKDGRKAWAKYSRFAIGNEHDSYRLNTLGSFRGPAGDSLSYHLGQHWSTRDRDHQKCAEHYRGAWWFKDCHFSNLNGVYGSNELGKGITWASFNGFRDSLKYMHMAIRPTQ